MLLNDLYPGVGTDIKIKGIKSNYQEVSPGDLFVYTYKELDSGKIIDTAIKKGALAIVVSFDVRNNLVPIIKVPDANRELPYLCQKFYKYPDRKMKVIGVSGTDGKSSVCKIIQELIGSSKCGFIDDFQYSCAGFNGESFKKGLRAFEFYNLLDKLYRFNCSHVALETSSEAFLRGQLQSVNFDVSVFTNFSLEHLDIYTTFENYIRTKLRLFNQTKKDGFCILNNDDQYFDIVRANCTGQILTYGKSESCTLQIVDFRLFYNKTIIKFKYNNLDFEVVSPMIGEVNVYNLAAGLLSCLALGFHLEDLVKNIGKINIDLMTRFLNTNTPYYLLIDYCHTLNSISKLLSFLKSIDINKIIVVLGCSRKNYNRTILEDVVCRMASHVIFTYFNGLGDNYTEEDILSLNIKNTYNNFSIELDRRDAIRKAVYMADSRDVVVIIGDRMGVYQKIFNKTIYCNDEECAYQVVFDRNINRE